MTPVERAWYHDARWLSLLAPLERLYRRVVRRRRLAYRSGRRAVWQPPVPLVVVGNLSVGGTGKSPLVAWLARDLVERGWRPGIVSRGYGGKARSYPLRVDADTPVAASGDEPLMLAQQCGVPVAVAPDRPAAARLLIDTAGCDVLLADDGLQHYALGRSLELVVVDGWRGFGNRHCLPRGPLREPLERLSEVDAVIGNGGLAPLQESDGVGIPRFSMAIRPSAWRHLESGECFPVDSAPFPLRHSVAAIAGIGRPQRFFETLTALGVAHTPHVFSDHHRFVASDLPQAADVIVMTAKDAVKCREFADGRCWVLDVEASPDRAFITWWQQQVESWQHGGAPAGADATPGESPSRSAPLQEASGSVGPNTR
ncbi:tetraacyldisaccharide 4'-kinase [Salinicola rhizosphaerae]|uniref:Tetraacyldisaccharide 4'-kinase n=1 Tax=Salinicola rhizosphaerae TaxID=1443141 RepID=A0ABQ3DMH5_9GAMM|nr:tetraacyldisaccharide 4'-kinase [Salinicola rhizosphaerae]GHB08043.1 tetraacyldisaccharide 4'-kinase [Salinicola rhizosphaerae]